MLLHGQKIKKNRVNIRCKIFNLFQKFGGIEVKVLQY